MGRSILQDNAEKVEQVSKEKKEPLDLLRTRTGGAYIPPAKLKMLQEQIADKNSEQYQRMNWERLKKKIHGQVISSLCVSFNWRITYSFQFVLFF